MHDLSPLPARDLVLDQRILEPDRPATELSEHDRRAIGIRIAPNPPHDQLVPANLADHHPVERRARPELLGGAVEDPRRRADLAEPPDGVGHPLERIRAPNITG